MIIRILGEGQFDVPDAELEKLNVLDAELEKAVGGQDQKAFDETLTKLLAEVRSVGTHVGDADLATSDLILPAEGSAIDDVADLLAEDGLIPG
jgi:PspA-Associated protein